MAQSGFSRKQPEARMNVLMLFVGDANPGGRKERDTDGERGLPAVQVTHVT